MKAFSLAATFWIALGPGSAYAGYINNKTDWDSLLLTQKGAYAIGAFDLWHQTYEDGETFAYKSDVADCVADLGLKSSDLATVIETEYADLPHWEKPPFALLLSGLRKVCLSQVNRARSLRGEGPLQ